mgnify:CR=1 FL=1
MEGTNNERPTVRASALYFVPERTTEKVGSAVQGKVDVKESPEELVNLSGLEITVSDVNPITIPKDVREKIEKLSERRLTPSAIARKAERSKKGGEAERA